MDSAMRKLYCFLFLLLVLAPRTATARMRGAFWPNDHQNRFPDSLEFTVSANYLTSDLTAAFLGHPSANLHRICQSDYSTGHRIRLKIQS